MTTGRDAEGGRDLVRDERAVRSPKQSPDDRDRAADQRDHTSDDHDRVAEARDARADLRDKLADARDAAGGLNGAGRAKSDREESRKDRAASARERAHSARDREASWSDRTMSAAERDALAIDELTGAHRRGPGELELGREIARAKRMGQRFVVAFVDVDGLKAVNDEFGHAAGDRLLRQTAATIRNRFRPYDLLVRFGGDEFVCGLPDVTTEEAAERFVLINEDLRAQARAAVTAGLAELSSEDSVEDVIKRADRALYEQRKQRRGRVSTHHAAPHQ